MAGDQTTNPKDREFAEMVGFALFDTHPTASSFAPNRSRAQDLLGSIEERVKDYLGDGFRPFSVLQRRDLGAELSEILKVIQQSHDGVLALAGMENGFGLKLVINTLDNYTMEAFRGGKGDRRIERLSKADAQRSVATLLADSMRFAASTGGSASSGQVNFTVNTTKTGYVLDSWAQWAITRIRFGSKTTTPVSGFLKTGRYYFEGKKGTDIQNDGSLSYAGGANTSTVLGW
ncbi:MULTISPECIES: hypothetical protein [unclassified Novosphingobium]|uniref:hypothetical protein n=1 Tax=unclassified Novosphingobium TaxID=2644732 RepID=UPI001493E155|nr:MULTISPECIES: hypothetical protein [unclassified Novosphingobium]MBB3356895.1 hypothetical protein [Novosphingobium sp. BK256]MBB3373296.1 hypothetical protein [Novosphingobium sp. BK280]MBB3377665.1 hypothetical protein [Novosphingobium sp. BK258]MBB3418924.1 hypothetical protein [Novosphingobium sp. BK267]MBB3450241.1 hypothetical protein [Novosphingobium sp. BK352]